MQTTTNTLQVSVRVDFNHIHIHPVGIEKEHTMDNIIIIIEHHHRHFRMPAKIRIGGDNQTIPKVIVIRIQIKLTGTNYWSLWNK